VSPSSLIRGYTVPFSSNATAVAYYAANCGAASAPITTASGVTTKFIVPFAGTIEALSYIWSTGSATATVSIIKNTASAYTTGTIFAAAGNSATVSGVTVTVAANDVIEVKTNNANIGLSTIVLYFT
jgi:hypothetical protein